MRISDLARQTDIPVPTIKYYLREGLLPAGRQTAPNQADYGDEHVRRLRLVRTLREIGGLDIGRIRRVVSAIDDPGLTRHELFGVVEEARTLPPATGATADDRRDARAAVDRFIAELGWQVRPDAAARADLADTLVALRHLGRRDGTDVFRPYAEAAGRMAAWEVASIPASEPRAVAVERMVVGTVVFGAAFDALRRLAHEHFSGTQA